jgi:PHD/YefM family antitoxin component YafN of YafNO toxin-antitoxin module
VANRRTRKSPEIVLRQGKPAAVILDIDDYREMLERLEDVEDLRLLKQMRRKKLRFRSLEEFLSEYRPGV